MKHETCSVIVVDAFRSFSQAETPTVVYLLVLLPSLELPRWNLGQQTRGFSVDLCRLWGVGGLLS
jgi:hypothetical protein